MNIADMLKLPTYKFVSNYDSFLPNLKHDLCPRISKRTFCPGNSFYELMFMNLIRLTVKTQFLNVFAVNTGQISLQM